MKGFIIFGIWAISLNALACPDLAGEWQCSDSEGTMWTESVTNIGDHYTIIVDKGSANEKRLDFIADGRTYEAFSGATKYLDAIMLKFRKKIDSQRNWQKRAMVRTVLGKFERVADDVVRSETSFTCEGNVLQGRTHFKGSVWIFPIFLVHANAEVATADAVDGSRRSTFSSTFGRALGNMLVFDLNPDEQALRIDGNERSECIKK